MGGAGGLGSRGGGRGHGERAWRASPMGSSWRCASRSDRPARLGGVDGLSFVASLVRSLAWPAAVVAAVLVWRRPLVGWLAVPPRRVKVGPGGVEAEWSEQTARVVGSLTPKQGGTEASPGPGGGVPEASDFAREMLALVDTASPIAAVEASYQQVGRALADMVESAEPGAAVGLNVGQLARAAHARGLYQHREPEGRGRARGDAHHGGAGHQRGTPGAGQGP